MTGAINVRNFQSLQEIQLTLSLAECNWCGSFRRWHLNKLCFIQLLSTYG